MLAVAVGLPQGIAFKQPSLYKHSELRRVYETLDKIQFIPLDTTSASTSVVTEESCPPCTDHD